MRLFISNFPFRTTPDDIRELLRDFGPAENVKIIFDEDGNSRGFGFADLEDAAACAAIEGLNGIGYGGRRLDVRKADPPKRRRVEVEA